jgi:hypothetical protein
MTPGPKLSFARVRLRRRVGDGSMRLENTHAKLLIQEKTTLPGNVAPRVVK